MGILNGFKKDFEEIDNKVEEQTEPEVPATPQDSQEEIDPTSDRTEFNCPSCNGEGLTQDQTARCLRCNGTGKV